MSPLHARLLEIIGRHAGKVNAPTILQSALDARSLSADALTDRDVAALVSLIERSAGRFQGVQSTEGLLRDLQALSAAVAVGVQRLVRVNAERDISEARATARILCDSGGLRKLTMQKIVTIVSELARNLVNYTPGGTIDLALKPDTRTFKIIAADEGRGIPNLEEIMAGRYKSKTGLGAGIIGVKRLSDHFEIQTGPTGTRIRSDVRY